MWRWYLRSNSRKRHALLLGSNLCLNKNLSFKMGPTHLAGCFAECLVSLVDTAITVILKKILASDPNVQHFKPPGFVCQACRVHSCQACSPSIVLSANQPQNRPVFLRNRIHMGWSKSPDSADQAFSQGVLRADASTKGRETHQSRTPQTKRNFLD
jgi:hypothetical protein